MSQLLSLGYISRTTQDLSDQQLDELLMVAREKNSQYGVTGMLLYVSRSFLQIIEGPQSVVADLFQVIRSDPRHTSIKMIFNEVVEQRDFANWSMGFRRLDCSSFANMEGVNAFLQGQETLDSYLISDTDSRKVRENLLMYFQQKSE